jgi:hypothetical protein
LIGRWPITDQEVIAMPCFGRASQGRRLTTFVVTVLTAISLGEGMAFAQVRVSPLIPPLDSSALGLVQPPADAARPREPRSLQPIQDSLRTIDFGPLARQSAREGQAQTPGSGRRRSVGRRILGGAIGATAGLFAGGYLGAVIEGDSCHCDDPGLKGALIGAPVGLVTGGILGALFF